jgi:predicted dehydrogenase
MADVRFGVIGLRRGGGFVRACNSVGGARVTALFDIDGGRVEREATALGVAAFTDLDAFLAANIDAVVIASPLPFHAEQAIATLGAGKHVLSEVTACLTREEARALVRAARSSDAIYMLAENYRYLDEVELVKRLHDAGRFGSVYYGEGEYIHDCRELWYNDDGSLTWRGRGELGVYGTHSLGPLLYITGDRVAQVSALAVPGGKYDPQVILPTMHSLHCATVGGALLRVRVDHVSPRPGRHAFYAIQGTHGCYESQHGFGDAGKVWLDETHEPSTYHAPAQWHALSDQAAHTIPERLAAPPEARTGGHGTSEYWMLKDLLAAIRGEIPVPIDIYRALDYTLPGICAAESAVQGGMPIGVPDPRDPSFAA